MSVFKPRAVTPKSTWRRAAGWMVVVVSSGEKPESGEGEVVEEEEIFHASWSMIDTEGWNQVV